MFEQNDLFRGGMGTVDDGTQGVLDAEQQFLNQSGRTPPNALDVLLPLVPTPAQLSVTSPGPSITTPWGPSPWYSDQPSTPAQPTWSSSITPVTPGSPYKSQWGLNLNTAKAAQAGLTLNSVGNTFSDAFKFILGPSPAAQGARSAVAQGAIAPVFGVSQASGILPTIQSAIATVFGTGTTSSAPGLKKAGVAPGKGAPPAAGGSDPLSSIMSALGLALPLLGGKGKSKSKSRPGVKTAGGASGSSIMPYVLIGGGALAVGTLLVVAMKSKRAAP